MDINTIDALDNLHIGLNIDAIESYVHNYKSAIRFSGITKYNWNYNLLCDVLRDVKPSSNALKEHLSTTKLDIEIYDVFFDLLKNKYAIEVFGQNDNYIDTVIKELYEETDTALHLVAIENIVGLDIKVTYFLGELKQICVVSENDKIIDITDLLKGMVPEVLSGILEDKPIVELRGKITLSKRNIRNNVICDVYTCIKRAIDLENIVLVFHDIFFDDMPDTFWKKIKIIKKQGFVVPRHGLIRDIDRKTFKRALGEITEIFKSETEYISYGFMLKLDNDADIYNFVMNYIASDANPNLIFTSRVKSVAIDGNAYYLNIVPVMCNDNCRIDKIELNDIYFIENNEITTGSKIKFNVVEGKAYLK